MKHFSDEIQNLSNEVTYRSTIDNKYLLRTDFEMPYHMAAKASDYTLRPFDTQRYSINCVQKQVSG